jgi:cytochrome c556
VGLAAQQGVPLDMMKALPLPFRKLGMDTHKKFDQLAANAEQGASNAQLLIELSQLMNNCVACHAAYQLKD